MERKIKMTLLYVLIGIAVVYAAFVFGTKKKTNQNYLAGQMSQPMPGGTHVHGSLDSSSNAHDDSEETHTQHKSHGGCC